MLTVYAALFVICLLLMGGLVGYAIGKVRAWRLMAPTIDQLVQERLAYRARAQHHERCAEEFRRLWQLWQRAAFQWARQGFPEHREHIDRQEAQLATNNLLILTRADYRAPRPLP